jgi:hypothetical protein
MAQMHAHRSQRQVDGRDGAERRTNLQILAVIASARRSNPETAPRTLDCFVGCSLQ